MGCIFVVLSHITSWLLFLCECFTFLSEICKIFHVLYRRWHAFSWCFHTSYYGHFFSEIFYCPSEIFLFLQEVACVFVGLCVLLQLNLLSTRNPNVWWWFNSKEGGSGAPPPSLILVGFMSIFLLAATFVGVYWPSHVRPDGGRGWMEGAGTPHDAPPCSSHAPLHDLHPTPAPPPLSYWGHEHLPSDCHLRRFHRLSHVRPDGAPNTPPQTPLPPPPCAPPHTLPTPQHILPVLMGGADATPPDTLPHSTPSPPPAHA